MELIDYKEFLEKNNFANLKEIEYFTRWVNRFLHFGLSDTLSNHDKVRQFVEIWRVDESLEDWQRDQGRKAGEIYLNMFLKNIEVRKMDNNLRFSQILEGMKTSLRLKHYAYRTEQTYLDWAKNIFIFA